jgi:hypothetical protein
MAVFDRSGSISAWIKAMRFGDFAEAGYWMTVLVENGIKEDYLAKRLAIFAAEDTIDTVTMTLANSVLLRYVEGLGDGNMLWQVLYRCCRASKFLICRRFNHALALRGTKVCVNKLKSPLNQFDSRFRRLARVTVPIQQVLNLVSHLPFFAGSEAVQWVEVTDEQGKIDVGRERQRWIFLARFFKIASHGPPDPLLKIKGVAKLLNSMPIFRGAASDSIMSGHG